MTTVIGIVNQQQEAGKTAMAVNVAAALALCEKKTLLVDSDPRGTATARLSGSGSVQDQGLDRLLLEGFDPAESIHGTAYDSLNNYLELMPAGMGLTRAESGLADTADREEALRRIFQHLPAELEYVIIDTPSSLDFLTTAAIVASDWLVLPVSCRAESIPPLSQLLAEIRRIRRQLNTGIKIAGLVFTGCQKEEEIQENIPADVLAGLQSVMLDITVPFSSESDAGTDPVILRDVLSSGAEPYLDLAALLIEKNNGTDRNKPGRS
ncbi:MAG: ParA family protein [Desulfosudaceae bacterium]